MRRERDNSSLIYVLIGVIGLAIAIAALIIISMMGSQNNKNRLKEAVNSGNSAAIIQMTKDIQGKQISKETYEGYKDSIKQAVFNELNGNGGANKTVRVEYSGFLVKKPEIILEEYTLDIKDINPELIIVVNGKEIKHGNEKEITVMGIPGENIIQLSMDKGLYNDTGSTARVNMEEGQIEAQIDTGYEFKDYVINVNQPAMLVINGYSVLELKSGDNTVNLPSNLNLKLSAVDPVNTSIKSEEVLLNKNNPKYTFTLKKAN